MAILTRKHLTCRQTINAPPDAVFPLICPVREAEWLDGWRYTMLFSVSGVVEQGAVFSRTDTAPRRRAPSPARTPGHYRLESACTHVVAPPRPRRLERVLE
jgi:hypothetical protein